MELLADLFDAGIHKRIPKDKAKAFGKEVRDGAAGFAKVIDSGRKPIAKATHYERMTTAIARSAQRELAGLKREYKAAGFSEAAIHEVIPDRPVKAAKAKKKDDEETK